MLYHFYFKKINELIKITSTCDKVENILLKNGTSIQPFSLKLIRIQEVITLRKCSNKFII